jgi:5-hydroxyisourate hydrolase-like protein (transthyretin family)
VPARLPFVRPALTTGGGRWIVALAGVVLMLAPACRGPRPLEKAVEPETLARTEFTERIENFFEYEPLTAGKPSRFLIHLTDLSDGSPVEKADVTLVAKPAAGSTTQVVTKAKIGRVTGIYVAEITAPRAGGYTIEFHVKNAKLDERMALSDFTVQ